MGYLDRKAWQFDTFLATICRMSPQVAEKRSPAPNASLAEAIMALNRQKKKEPSHARDASMVPPALGRQLLELKTAIDAPDFRDGISCLLGSTPVKNAVAGVGIERHVERLFRQLYDKNVVRDDIAKVLGKAASDRLTEVATDAVLAASILDEAEQKKKLLPARRNGPNHVDYFETLPPELRELIFPGIECHVALLFLDLMAIQKKQLKPWMAEAAVDVLHDGYRAILACYGSLTELRLSEQARVSPIDWTAIAKRVLTGDILMDRFARKGAKALKAGARSWPDLPEDKKH